MDTYKDTFRHDDSVKDTFRNDDSLCIWLSQFPSCYLKCYLDSKKIQPIVITLFSTGHITLAEAKFVLDYVKANKTPKGGKKEVNKK